MVQLQRPKFAFYQGQVRPWEGAVIHVGAEGTYRGINVFEGLKAYWQPDGSMGLLAVPRHYERLKRSARLMHIPFELSLLEFENALHSLVEALCVPESDMWIRATVYLVDGLWGEDQRSDLYLTAFQTSKSSPASIRMGVSTWKRATDQMLPARIKTSSNYQVSRFARIEGRSRGYSDMILLNNYDRVAESGVACVLVARDGSIATPTHSEGALESITVDIIEQLAHEMRIPFERRPIDRTELYIADEIMLCGTVTEMTPVVSVDGFECTQKTNLLTTIAKAYAAAVRGTERHPLIDLSCRKHGGKRLAASQVTS